MTTLVLLSFLLVVFVVFGTIIICAAGSFLGVLGMCGTAIALFLLAAALDARFL